MIFEGETLQLLSGLGVLRESAGEVEHRPIVAEDIALNVSNVSRENLERLCEHKDTV